MKFSIHILDQLEQLLAVENLQRQVWPGSETDIVPVHMLLTAVNNGGLIMGAYPPGPLASPEQASTLAGFVYGFPGLYFTPDGPRPKHCSHMLGVHPEFRNQGAGFALKRAQWQMVRHQGLDRITWTYDPLLSPNAYLNITRLGGVCNIYQKNLYGEMRDGLNAGLPSDRFQVDWWVNSKRVNRRLSKRPRLPLDLAHFLSAGAQVLNAGERDAAGWLHPPARQVKLPEPGEPDLPALVLVEVPSDFQSLKSAEPGLALDWRMHTRVLFSELFQRGYIVTDFIHLSESLPVSFYVLSHGESTL